MSASSGLATSHLEPGIYMKDFVGKTYQVPYPTVGRESLIDRLHYIHSWERLDLLIPNFDAELFNYNCQQPLLVQQLGVKVALPTREQFEARHKLNLYDSGMEHGIRVPMAKQADAENEVFAWGFSVRRFFPSFH